MLYEKSVSFREYFVIVPVLVIKEMVFVPKYLLFS